MMNPNLILFKLSLVLSTVMVISANSWISIWIGLEMNLLSFLPLMQSTLNSNSNEVMIKYFLVQIISSMMILLMIMSSINFNMSSLTVTSLPLMIKMGIAPFHFWFLNIMEGLNWFNCLIILTWQKIAPMSIIILIYNKPFITMMATISILTGMMGGLNQTSIRKILAYSSINHLGWMMMILTLNEKMWLTYLTIYFIVITALIIPLENFMFNIKQTMSKKSTDLYKFISSINLLSLGGLPPFLGFLLKWWPIQLFLHHKLILFSTLAMASSIPILMYYISIIYSNLMISSSLNPWKPKSQQNPASISSLSINMIPLLSLM